MSRETERLHGSGCRVKALQPQRGFTLVGTLLALSIVASLLPFYFQLQSSRQARADALEIGTQLAQYNAGVRAFMSDKGAQMLASVGCTPGALCRKTGTGWLKNRTNCPTATGALTLSYLPCTFMNALPSATPITTYLFRRADGTNYAVTQIPAPLGPDALQRPDLASVAVQAANTTVAGLGVVTVAGGAPAVQPIAGAFYQYYWFPATGGTWTTYTANEAPRPAPNSIVAEANSAPSLDAWLRTDGSNSMQADLQMNGHNVLGVSNLDASGIVTAQDIINKSINGGVAMSTAWVGSIQVNRADQTGIPRPFCVSTGQGASGLFIPTSMAYYPLGDAILNADAKPASITAYSYQLGFASPSATTWSLVINVKSPQSPNTSTQLDTLSTANSKVTGTIITSCPRS